MAGTAHAQPACGDRPNLVNADLGLHVVGVGYQRRLTCWLSVELDLDLYVPWTVNDDVLGLGGSDWAESYDVRGLGPRLRAFVHPFSNAPRGLWISPYTQLMLVRATRAGQSVDGTAFAVGLSAGWSWLIADRVRIALGLGAQYHQATLDGSQRAPGFARFAPTVDIQVGWAF